MGLFAPSPAGPTVILFQKPGDKVWLNAEQRAKGKMFESGSVFFSSSLFVVVLFDFVLVCVISFP